MFIKELSLFNFKNYEDVHFGFTSRLNCLVGNNGVGKTNLLDAIYYLSNTKSYFNPVDSMNIRHGAEYFIIKAGIPGESREDQLACRVQRGKNKKLSRNKKDYQKLSEHIGFMPVVMVSPADSALVLEGSGERRKFIDLVISQYDRSYLNDLIDYNRALKQRNSLLKHFAKERTFSEASLELWDQQMIAPAARIYEKRQSFVDEITPSFQEYYERISEGREKVALLYKSGLKEHSMDELLKANREKDRLLQHTSAGIHKDDLGLMLGEYPIKRLGSQGQQKTYLLALKLAKFDFIKKNTGKQPILLLDDIFDKFDAHRVEQIIRVISGSAYGQIFISDTHQTRLENMLEKLDTDYKIFRINDGITEISSVEGKEDA